MSDNEIIKVKLKEISEKEPERQFWAMLAVFHFPLGFNQASLVKDLVKGAREVLEHERS